MIKIKRQLSPHWIPVEMWTWGCHGSPWPHSLLWVLHFQWFPLLLPQSRCQKRNEVAFSLRLCSSKSWESIDIWQSSFPLTWCKLILPKRSHCKWCGSWLSPTARDDKLRGAILRRELGDQIHTCHKSHCKGHMSKCFLQLVCCGEWAVWEQNRTHPRVQDRINLQAETLWVNFFLCLGTLNLLLCLYSGWVMFPGLLLLLGHLWILATLPGWQGVQQRSLGSLLRGWVPSQAHVSCCACRTCHCAWQMESWECTEEIPHTPLHPFSAPTVHTSRDLLIQTEVWRWEDCKRKPTFR